MSTKESKIGERNIQSVLDGVASFNAKDFDRTIENLAPDYVWHSSAFPHPVVGPQETKKHLEEIFMFLPDAEFVVKEIFASGSHVETLFAVKGSHTQGFMGLPPTDRSFEVLDSVINIFNEEGVRQTTWDVWDRASLLEQQGIIPGPSVGSFLGKKTVIIGEGYKPALRPGGESMPNRADDEIIQAPALGVDFPPGGDPYTYKLGEVDRLLSQIANFIMMIAPGSKSANLPIKVRGQLVGAKFHQRIHRLNIRNGHSAVVGQTIGHAVLDWQPIPEEFIATATAEPPTTPFEPTKRQRCLTQGRFEFNDVQKSGFDVFGTGLTWPTPSSGTVAFGTVLNIRNSHGKLEGLEGTVVMNGDITSPGPVLRVNTILRARDPTGNLVSPSRLPAIRSTSEPDPEITSLLFMGDMDPANPVTFNLSPEGRMIGANGHERLRLAEIQCATSGPSGLRSKSQAGMLAGEIDFTVYFDAFQSGSPLPFQTRNAVIRLWDHRKREIGTLNADIVEGRAFPTKLPGAPMEVFRMGSLAPVCGGTGAFEGARGMVSVDVWLSVLPRTLASVVVVRLLDPEGRFRAATARAWS